MYIKPTFPPEIELGADGYPLDWIPMRPTYSHDEEGNEITVHVDPVTGEARKVEPHYYDPPAEPEPQITIEQAQIHALTERISLYEDVLAEIIVKGMM